MRTFAFLAALFLLALLAQAEPVPQKAEDALEEQQPEEEDQGVTVSFTGAESAGLQDAARGQVVTCTCRRPSCFYGEYTGGSCTIGGISYLLCCR